MSSSRLQCNEQQVDADRVSNWQQPQRQFSCTYTYDMGRDSPGALLDMLAEVASQTLHSEKKLSEMDTKPAKPKTRKNTRKASQTVVFTVHQLLTMPATQLIKLFTVFSSDELKRHYTYSCALVPGCGQSFTSFASEDKARLSIQEHLAMHLEFLKNNSETYASFTATAVKYTKPKATAQTKRTRVTQAKKPLKETLNKENKDSPLGKTTNHLRKILSNEVNLKEYENNSGQEKVVDYREACDIKKEIADMKVLGDHSYYETIKQEYINGESTSTIERVPDPLSEENIMLMVVDSNGVCMKDTFDTEKQAIEENTTAQDMSLWKADLNPKCTTADNYMPAKPKGKAKFIGTSKEEREMALILIEKIRKKGNPTGNNLQCRICDPPRSFTAPTTLVSHYRSHAGIKPYECRICRAVFTRRHSLKYHMLIHQNQTRFTCADCGKKFRHPSHFREHRRRHTGEAPFGCEDCGQRFKTRNTYKRHLKTRHGKVLTITGELLHLSEEDSKKVKTKNRRKKQSNNENTINDNAVPAANVIMEPVNSSEFTWQDRQQDTNINENNVDQCINDAIWMYDDNQIEVNDENSVTENQNDKSHNNNKTDFNETEVESNFDHDEVVIAQTDSDGTLRFENYSYSQDAVYTNNETIEFSCEENICTEVSTNDAKQFENEETVVEYQESTENYSEEVESIFPSKSEPVDDVFILGNEEIITSDEVEESNEKQITTTISDSTQTEESVQTDELPEEKPMKIIPCQVKVCDNNGTPTLQLLNNSKIALLGSRAQSINLIQNGKQHTFLLLASSDNNLLDIDNSCIIEGTKSLPVIAVPAE